MKFVRNLLFLTIAFLVLLYLSVWVPLNAFDLLRGEWWRIFAAEVTSGTVWHIFLFLLIVIVGFILSVTIWVATFMAGGAWLNLAVDMDRKREAVMQSIDEIMSSIQNRFSRSKPLTDNEYDPYGKNDGR